MYIPDQGWKLYSQKYESGVLVILIIYTNFYIMNYIKNCILQANLHRKSALCVVWLSCAFTNHLLCVCYIHNSGRHRSSDPKIDVPFSFFWEGVAK